MLLSPKYWDICKLSYQVPFISLQNVSIHSVVLNLILIERQFDKILLRTTECFHYSGYSLLWLFGNLRTVILKVFSFTKLIEIYYSELKWEKKIMFYCFREGDNAKSHGKTKPSMPGIETSLCVVHKNWKDGTKRLSI